METRSSIIRKFWLTHYDTNNQTETIDMKEGYNICILTNPKQNDIDIDSFISIVKFKRIKTRRDRNKEHKFFFAQPTSGEAKQYHREFKNHENKDPQSSIDFCLINIWGLITKNKIK